MVSLKNLYTQVKYVDERGSDPKEIHSDIEAFLGRFIRDSETMAAFIEGDAGVGKSSLISYLAYHYRMDDDVKKCVFGDYKLVIVRLRDIIPDSMRFSKGNPMVDILKYLKASSLDDIRPTNGKLLFILDGFDELCMINDMSYGSTNCMTSILLALRECKLIVTTRPKYLYVQGLDFRKIHVTITHFDREQRMQFLHNFQTVCAQQIDENVLTYLSDIDDAEGKCIADTPMVLYMMIANRFKPSELKNKWALYRRIFYRELSQTEYNRMFNHPTGTVEHAINTYSGTLYRIASAIAFAMFQKSNRLFVEVQYIGNRKEKEERTPVVQ